MILNPNESFKKIFSHFVTLSGSIRSLVYTFLVYQKNMYMYVKIYYGGTNPKCRVTGILYKEWYCIQICIHLPCYWMVKFIFHFRGSLSYTCGRFSGNIVNLFVQKRIPSILQIHYCHQ